MKLITEEFEELFKDYPLYSQEKSKDPLVIAKLFDPTGSATWYLTEYCPERKLAFGYVKGLCEGGDELGYISMEELESLEQHGIIIERDIYFQSKNLSQIVNRN
jgi:hypothetical protein